MSQDPSQGPAARTYPADRPLRLRRDLTALGVGVLAFLIFQLLSLFPTVVEALYARGVGPLITRPLSLLSGVLPFSLVEVIVVSYVTWLWVTFGRTVPDVLHRRRRLKNVVLSGTLRLARDVGLLITVFYIAWGFNYARRPLSERLLWPEWSPPDVAALELAAAEIVDAANQAYWEIHHTEDAGEPTQMPALVSELDQALEAGWSDASRLLRLADNTGKRYGRTKRLVLSPIVARFGIAGFYFPWTGEANVLWDSPAVGRAQSMAHEKAHQRGIGPESEANFLGFVAGAVAPHPLARYSAYVFAQNQILGVLARADRDAAKEIASRRFPGIRRDLEDWAEYRRRFRGVGTSIGRAMNDRFLRANRVQGGVLSYGRSVRLLLTFAEQNDGRVVPGS